MTDYAAIARWLGEPYFHVHIYEGEDYILNDSSGKPEHCSDADLVLAVLEKLARDRISVELYHAPDSDGWELFAWSEDLRETVCGPTPILAINALIAELEKAK